MMGKAIGQRLRELVAAADEVHAAVRALSERAERAEAEVERLREEVETLTRERDAALAVIDCAREAAGGLDSESLSDATRRLARERDEARAAFLACAEVIGVVRHCEGQGSEPGPVADVVEAIERALAQADRVGESIEAALGEHSTGDAAADVRRLVERVEALECGGLGVMDGPALYEPERVRWARDAVRALGCERNSLRDRVAELESSVARYRTERDEAITRAKRAEQERDYWWLSAGNAGRLSADEARAIGAVLRAADGQISPFVPGAPGLAETVDVWRAAGRPGMEVDGE